MGREPGVALAKEIDALAVDLFDQKRLSYTKIKPLALFPRNMVLVHYEVI